MFAKSDQFPFYIPAKFIRLIKKCFNTRAQRQLLLSIAQALKYKNMSFLDFLKSGERSLETYLKRLTLNTERALDRRR